MIEVSKTTFYIVTILLFILFSLFITDTFAFEVPKDAIIKVYTKDGKKIGEMKRSEYKVVQSNSICQPRVEYVYSKVRIPVHMSNSVIVHGGVSKSNLVVSNSTNHFSAQERYEQVFGASYCRNWTENGACVTGLNNNTFMLGYKRNF